MTPEVIAKLIDFPLDEWTGKCYFVAAKMIEMDLVKGELIIGYYFNDDIIVDHGWIKTSDGQVYDPTRWTLDNEDPYVFIGNWSGYDVEGVEWDKLWDNMREALSHGNDQYEKLKAEIDQFVNI